MPPLETGTGAEAAGAAAEAEATEALAKELVVVEEEGVGRFGLPSTIAANLGDRASSLVNVSASAASECSREQPGSEQVDAVVEFPAAAAATAEREDEGSGAPAEVK
jgi:hypothetical protein